MTSFRTQAIKLAEVFGVEVDFEPARFDSFGRWHNAVVSLCAPDGHVFKSTLLHSANSASDPNIQETEESHRIAWRGALKDLQDGLQEGKCEDEACDDCY